MRNWQAVKYIVGIDEVGRGPVAGPLLLVGVSVRASDKKKAEELLDGIKDSKKLSEKQREEWFTKLKGIRRQGLLDWKISFVTPQKIDENGIAHSLRTTVSRILKNLEYNPKKVGVLLDGSLYAPKEYLYQETIVKGEDKEKLIAAASIVGKVTRDRRMRNYSKKYPEYGFEKHKGYGTKEHLRMIYKHGVCRIHRHSFLD